MSARNVGIIYRKELRDELRDRRTLVSMVLVPVLVMPALTIGMAYVSIKMLSKARREVAKVMVLGGEDSPRVMAGLRQVPRIELVPPRTDYADLIT